MRIAVLGAGHGAYAAAADLAEQGHEIRLWRRDARTLPLVADTWFIRLEDYQGRRDVRIALATPDIGQAVQGVELILVPAPAFAQMDIAAALAPHIVDGQVVFLPPGTFGSFAMARRIRPSSRSRMRSRPR
jgi:opine dehydrogenase